jgi:hypothetical protein
MKDETVQYTDEPVGIVISGGSRKQAAPRFRAYEWAPAPDTDDTGAQAA